MRFDDATCAVCERGRVGGTVADGRREKEFKLLAKQTIFVSIILSGNVELVLLRVHVSMNKVGGLAETPHSGCCREGVGAVADVSDDICSELRTGALRCLLPCRSRVCRPQKPPPDRHGLVAHQLHGNHRARGHKLHQVTENRAAC